MANNDILCQLLIIVKVSANYEEQAKIHRQISQDCSPVGGEFRVKQSGGDVIFFAPSVAVHGSEAAGLADYVKKLTKLFGGENQQTEFHLAYLTETRAVLISDKETFDTDVFIGASKYASAVGVCRPHGNKYQWQDFAPAYFTEAAEFLEETRRKFIENQVGK